MPQEGAEVYIQAPNGSERTVITQHYTENPNDPPYYKVSLSEQPLNITAGQTITITARYSSHESTLVYVVQNGGQHVDVTLPTGQSDDYIYKDMLWGQSGQGTFDYPQSVTVDARGNLYVMDTGNARVQAFRGPCCCTWPATTRTTTVCTRASMTCSLCCARMPMYRLRSIWTVRAMETHSAG